MPFYCILSHMNLAKTQIPRLSMCRIYIPISNSICLATIGVCVFRALTSVGALFYFWRGCAISFSVRKCTNKRLSRWESSRRSRVRGQVFTPLRHAHARHLSQKERLLKTTFDKNKVVWYNNYAKRT